MAPPAAKAKNSSLKQRIVSSLVLGPVALGAIYLGAPYLEFLLGVLGLAMAWEWSRICGRGTFDRSGWVSAAAVLVAIALSAVSEPRGAVAAPIVGAAVVYILAWHAKEPDAVIRAAAPIAIGLACVSISWLRSSPDAGLGAVIWLVGAVWTTDIAAYFVGRRIGGPRLAPRISPKKTWSGLVGGVICTACWGLLWGVVPGSVDFVTLGVLGAATAVIAQAGDLSISMLKRRYGAKDASDLIPGHGGVLDRFDGILAAAPAIACYVWIMKDVRWPPL